MCMSFFFLFFMSSPSFPAVCVMEVGGRTANGGCSHCHMKCFGETSS